MVTESDLQKINLDNLEDYILLIQEKYFDGNSMEREKAITLACYLSPEQKAEAKSYLEAYNCFDEWDAGDLTEDEQKEKVLFYSLFD